MTTITTGKYPQEQVESNVKDLLTSTCQVSSGLNGRGPRFNSPLQVTFCYTTDF